ncbi:MAG: ABC transporter substrate-binding protein [Clostridia bacterium]|nr:ABC transporter substrate-binding protein [Clostridia bacterium]
MKRFLFLIIALVLCFNLTGCGEKEETDVLNVYNWGEYISDGSEGSMDVNEAFKEYYKEKYGRNLELNYTTYASNEDMYNKIKSGGVNYDVIFPSDYMIAKMIDEDMLYKLDFSNIPNFKYIDDKYKNVYYDKSGEYTVPYFCGYVGIIYNQSLISDKLSDWDCLWNEKYSGQILQFNNPRDAFGTAMYSKQIDVNTTDRQEWEESAKLLKQQKPLVQSYVMDEIFNKMKNGSAAIAPYYAGDFLSMYCDNEDLAFFYPQSGTNVFIDAMCIPKCSKNKTIAEEYINFFLTEEIAVANAEWVCYASPNTLVKDNPDYIESMTEIHEDAIEILYPTSPVPSTFYEKLDFETTDILNSLWEELKIENSVEPWVYIFSGILVLSLVLLMTIRYAKRKIRERYY